MPCPGVIPIDAAEGELADRASGQVNAGSEAAAYGVDIPIAQ